MLTNCLTACTHLSSTVSQLFEPQVQKLTFSRTAAHIFVSHGDAPAIITQYVAWMERQFDVCRTPRSIYLSIFNSFWVIRCLNQCVSTKIAIFTYRSPHFCFPWRRPCDTQYVAWMERQFNACQTPRSMYRSIFNSFRVIRCLSQCISPKIAIFTTVSPGDAPGEITLNVVWMERKFDAYKLSRSMYPSIFNSFPVIRTASAKNCRFHVPQPTFLFPLGTPLRLSHNMLHGWKDNSMFAKPLAAYTYLSSTVSKLYDA